MTVIITVIINCEGTGGSGWPVFNSLIRTTCVRPISDGEAYIQVAM